MTISFSGKVAIVTGAGGGLGREYALELARRGAKVVVNDLGGSRDGTGHSDAALKVVEEIKAAGGEAMSNGGSVTEYDQMVEMVAKTKEAWDGVHILINNAGILRDKSFTKMEIADFELVVRVHLLGSANCTKAVWDTMREQNYGRILMTASSTGLYGNFGQTNYGAAKLGLAGLTKSLYLEGAKNNVKVNTLAPIAATRMTEDILPPEAFKAFDPVNVVPAALYLVSDDAPSNAIVFPRGKRHADQGCWAARGRTHSRRRGRTLGGNHRPDRRNRSAVRRRTVHGGDRQAAEPVRTVL
jgi:NAD(P)-dependent dehydrogenase (short-subunit alcohol dehydrogenase family)